MKSALKRFVLLTLAAVLFLTFSGCSALEELREDRVFLREDGSILWEDTVYKPLPESDLLVATHDTFDTIMATAPDVPLLLSGFLVQECLTPANDGLLLEGDSGTFYCREDIYENLLARLKSPFEPDIVCYQYADYDYVEGEFVSVYYQLTDTQLDAISTVFSTVEPTTMGEGWNLESDWELYLLECSEDMLLQRNSMDLICCGSTYYLFLYSGLETLVFQVPEAYSEVIGNIAQAQFLTNFMDAEVYT